MCLYIKRDQLPQVAEEDITCYKQVEEKLNNEGIYTTFYMKAEVKLGEKYSSELEKYNLKLGVLYVIEKGLHSFSKLEDAIDDLQDGITRSDSKSHVIECIIPKGSTYYLGTYAHLDCFASDIIVYSKNILYTFNHPYNVHNNSRTSER
jgi:hypothetical protein